MKKRIMGVVKLPREAFSRCPGCGGREIRAMADEVYCGSCGWDSALAFVNAGGLDALIYEYEMKLQRQTEQAAAEKQKLEGKIKQPNMRRAI